MDLKGKIDKKIKRYLNSICEDKKESKVFNSIHYTVSIGGVLKDIRFSDHLTTRVSRLEKIMDIIKVTDDLYQLWFDNGHRKTFTGSEIVDYIKGYILTKDEFSNHFDTMASQLMTALKEISRLSKSQLNQQLIAANKTIKERDECIRQQTIDIQNKKEEIKKLNTKLQKFKELEGHLNKLKNFLNNSIKL